MMLHVNSETCQESSVMSFKGKSATLPSSVQLVSPALEPGTLMLVEPASSEERGRRSVPTARAIVPETPTTGC